MHMAGQSGLGVLQAAKEQTSYVMGMGQDQWRLAPWYVVLSQSKDMGAVTFDLIKQTKENSFPGNQVQEVTLKEKAIGIVGLEHMQKTLGSAFPPDLKQRLEEITFEIQRQAIPLGVPKKKGLCDCL